MKLTAIERTMRKMEIDASITHWERVFDGKDFDISTDSCSLCRHYFEFPSCDGCPLEEYFGRCSANIYREKSSIPNPWGEIRELVVCNILPPYGCRETKLQEAIGVMLMCLYLLREIVKDDTKAD